ncbi:MAG TPA: hypothetical protein VLF39_01470 [Candidatus Saccharimonadales bacterium]|nr:hypothetical protein [Candidatus Saccharimonadales bacterium]
MLFDLLHQQLIYARQNDLSLKKNATVGKKIVVPKTGKTISLAYEQLRNAAEYAEDHLLLQRAIRRFLKRRMYLSQLDLSDLGEDLIIELVQAGYLKDADFGQKIAGQINELVDDYLKTYNSLRRARVHKDQAQDWILSILSIEIESLLNPHSYHSVVLYVAHQHFLKLLPKDQLVFNQTEAEQFEIALYVAIHLALFKSDTAVIRHDLVRVYHQDQKDIKGFILFNQKVNELYSLKLTGRLRRLILKNGAPFRILNSLADDYPDFVDVLANRKQFLSLYKRQIEIEFSQVRQRVDRGIIKSIIFILITKTIIGLGIEIPYDLLTSGAIGVLPLFINLATPPLYMASLKLGLRLPDHDNVATLESYIDTALYTDDQPPLLLMKKSTSPSAIAGWIHTIVILIPFAIVVYVLRLLHFTVPQVIIFFTFLSTASFLGFRLGGRIREVEFGTRRSSGLLASIRDYFYLPFIIVGQWLSGRYAKINIIGNILDIMIELPLKTVLKLIRQWMSFMDQKQEEIL